LKINSSTASQVKIVIAHVRGGGYTPLTVTSRVPACVWDKYTGMNSFIQGGGYTPLTVTSMVPGCIWDIWLVQ